MGKIRKNAANDDPSINISLSLLNDSNGDKLVQYLRRAKGVRSGSGRIFNANDISPRKSFPVEVSTSRIVTEENDNAEPQEEKGNENVETTQQDLCDMILATQLENEASNLKQRSAVKSRRSSTGLQKIVRLRELQKAVKKNGFNPLISSTPVQSIKRLLDENFASLSNIKGPENTFSVPKNASSTDNANSIITISDDRPSSTLNNSQHTSEPQIKPLMNQSAKSAQLQMLNKSVEVTRKGVSIVDDKENELVTEPDQILKYSLRRNSPNKTRNVQPQNKEDNSIRPSSIQPRVIIIPITQNVTSPANRSNQENSRGQEKEESVRSPLKRPNEVKNRREEYLETVRSPSKHPNEEKCRQEEHVECTSKNGRQEGVKPDSAQGKNMDEEDGGMCELLITSDEDAKIDVPKEERRANGKSTMNLEGSPRTPSAIKKKSAGQGEAKVNTLSLKRQRPIGHRIIKTLNSSTPHEQSGILDLRCNRISQGEAAMDLRVEEKQLQSAAKKRLKKARLPVYLKCKPSDDDSSDTSATESERNESGGGEIIHDNCNVVCDLPSVMKNVKTMNKCNPLKSPKFAISKKIELLKNSYFRTTNALKPRRSCKTGRRKLYSGEASDIMSESQPSIEIIRSDRRLTRRTLELLKQHEKLSSQTISHTEGDKIDSSNSKNVTVIEANEGGGCSTKMNEIKSKTHRLSSIDRCGVNKESPDSGLDDNSIADNDASKISNKERHIRLIAELPTALDSEPAEQIKRISEQKSSKKIQNKNSKKNRTRNPNIRGIKPTPIGSAEGEILSEESTRRSKRTKQLPQVPSMLFNVWSQDVIDRMQKEQTRKASKEVDGSKKRNSRRKKKEIPPKSEEPVKSIGSRVNHANKVQDEYLLDGHFKTITGKDTKNKRSPKTQKKQISFKPRKTAEELFDELKAREAQTQNSETSNNPINKTSSRKDKGQTLSKFKKIDEELFDDLKAMKATTQNDAKRNIPSKKKMKLTLSKPKTMMEDIFDELKARNSQIQNDEVSDNQSFIEVIPSLCMNSPEKKYSGKKGKNEESNNHNKQSQIQLDTKKSKTQENRNKRRKHRLSGRERNIPLKKKMKLTLSKRKTMMEDIFDELKARNSQIQNDEVSDNQSFIEVIPSLCISSPEKKYSGKKGKNEESNNHNKQSQIQLNTKKSNTQENRNKRRKYRLSGRESLVRVTAVTQHSIEIQKPGREQYREVQMASPEDPKGDRFGHSVATSETARDTACSSRNKNEEESPKSLFTWLTNLATENEPEKQNETITKIRSIPESLTIATIRSLKFEEINGVGYAFYISDGDSQHFGYIRFQPNSYKKQSRAKKYDLKFLCLIGGVQLKCDSAVPLLINPGDFFTIHKGALYELKNVSKHLAVLFFTRMA